MTIAPGLCSITFRSLSADEVLDLAARAGVEGIEWGADGHAPPGGGAALEALAARCADAGVEVVSHGSYLGFAPPAGDDAAAVDAVLDSVQALGAPMVRIWTELGVTPESSADNRGRVVERTAMFADAIAARGLIAALEFHPFTLTHTAASANEVLATLARANLRTHWQPDPALPAAAALAELTAVTPSLAHLHLFTWGAGGIGERRPLADGADLWTAALSLADREGASLPGRRFALCEYVRDDDPEQFVTDVQTLRRWLANL
ncbi:MAG: TIM barrel protein [Actinobacteria bacterium]|nr:MAG: TIM barrel protein [Actinomycetota bacterium]